MQSTLPHNLQAAHVQDAFLVQQQLLNGKQRNVTNTFCDTLKKAHCERRLKNL